MNLANWITISRILLIPVFVGLALYYGKSAAAGQPVEAYRIAAVAVFLAACVSDFVDGWVARRFNHLYGREANSEALALAVVKKMSKADGKAFSAARKEFQETGSEAALEHARTLIAAGGALSAADRERLDAFLRGTGKTILHEPAVLLTEVSKLPGLGGAKMSKSYGNAVLMRDDVETVTKKIRGMTTDPARVRRTDPGDPAKCPVWQFHKVYSDEATKDWVVKGCKSAGIGCLDCKQPVIDAILREQQPWRERAEAYLSNPKQVQWIVEVGTERARTVAATL